MNKVQLFFQQVVEILWGLDFMDKSDRVAENWSEGNIPVTSLQIGGFRLESIPPEAHLAVEVNQNYSSWGPDEPDEDEGGDNPRDAIEAVYHAIYKSFDDAGDLEVGEEGCFIRVTAAVETNDGLEVYVQHLVAEVEVCDLEEVGDGGPPGLRLGCITLRYLGDADSNLEEAANEPPAEE